MANDNISKFHGEISKCTCGTADGKVSQNERACRQCFGRGFVAQCKACLGKGQVHQDMAGGPGKMWSTCIPCGGTGLFAVNKPADWVDEAPVVAAQETAQVTA